jgi:hypothetical protein
VTGQHRSTQRHGGKIVDIEEAKLRQRLQEIAAGLQSAPLGATHIRWGRRMAYRLLRREGRTVNHKRVQRLWREEGLQRPTPRKRKRARPADGSVRRHRAEHPHQVWAGTESSARWAGYYEGAIQAGMDAARTVQRLLTS